MLRKLSLFLSERPILFASIYAVFVLVDLLVLRLYGIWHIGVLVFILILLLSQTLIIKQKVICLSSSLYIIITVCIAAYDLGGLPKSDVELSMVQLLRIIENFVVLSAIYSMYKHLGLQLELGWKRLLLIFIIPLVFILFLFDVFSFPLQVVLIVRISQIAIISSYVFFVFKPIHWGFTAWILFLTLLGVTGALRVAEVFDTNSLIAEDIFELFSFLFFVIGLKQTLKKNYLHD